MSLSELASISAKAIFRFMRSLRLLRSVQDEPDEGVDFLRPARALPVAMKACGSAQYWARELGAMGHEVLLLAPAYIKPYVKRGKNDALDAAPICAAMSRPAMRFVPVKSADQQAVLMLHKTRELLVKQRTMSVNALRGHLAEFGLVVAKGISRVGELLELAERDGALPQEAREIGQTARLPSRRARSIDRRRGEKDRRRQPEKPDGSVARSGPGVGPLNASVSAASVPFRERSSRDATSRPGWG